MSIKKAFFPPNIFIKVVQLIALSGIAISANIAAQPISEADQIDDINNTFYSEVVNNPEKNFNVVATFEKPIKIKHLEKSFNGFEVRIIGLMHGDKHSSGGYRLPKDESLEDAIAAYGSDLLLHNLDIVENLQSQIDTNNTDFESADKDSKELLKEMNKSIDAEIRILRHTNNKIRNEGIYIVGVELVGKGAELENFANSKPELSKIMQLVDGKEVVSPFFTE